MGRKKASEPEGAQEDKETGGEGIADSVAAGAIEGAGAALKAGGDARDVAAATIGGAAAATAEALGANETGEEAPEELDPADNDAFDDRLERLIELATEAEFESGTLVGDIRDFLIEDAKNRPKPWSQMSQSQQGDFARNAEALAKKIIHKVVVVIAEEDDITVHAKLNGYSADGGTFKLKLTARGDGETAIQLFHLDGHDVVLISADSNRFAGQRRDPPIQADQASLEFADGAAGKPPADDADLAGEEEIRTNLASGNVETLRAGDLEDERIATPDELVAEWRSQTEAISGEEMEVRVDLEAGTIEALDQGAWSVARLAYPAELAFADPGATYRVNVKTGMIERQPMGADSEHWEDIRAAEPDELAAERESKADFEA